MSAWFNENNPEAAEWLRELMREKVIPQGDVDERDIRDVEPRELKGYTQCHFFAGIGVWSAALRLAGFPDTRKVWTGSCPCQPFSAAGKGGGFDDERHLWPAWHHLIRVQRPELVLGEQVASQDGLAWLDLVHSDMEGEGYAFAARDLCAAGFGAPHIRQRLFFVADAQSERRNGGKLAGVSGGAARSVAEAKRRRTARIFGSQDDRHAGELGNTDNARSQGRGGGGDRAGQRIAGPAGVVGGFWSGAEFIPCTDGKHRPVEPGSFPLAHGVARRVGLLRGYGNAIVLPVAAEFVAAYLEGERAR